VFLMGGEWQGIKEWQRRAGDSQIDHRRAGGSYRRFVMNPNFRPQSWFSFVCLYIGRGAYTGTIWLGCERLLSGKEESEVLVLCLTRQMRSSISTSVCRKQKEGFGCFNQ